MVRILLSDVGPDGTEDLAAYRARGGYEALRQAVGGRSPAEILALVEAAGLRGRGGAAFPTARKWALAAGRTAPRKYVVANGGEHEPGSDKDKVLVTRHPHAVLEGMALCAFATGASEGVLYLIEDMAAPIASAERAIAEARAAGLLGADVLGSGFSFDVRIARGPTTYVAGEETAALDAIEGGAGKPRRKPPYPGEAGLGGMPTTVNNVETLAHVPWIVRHGSAAFAAIGTAESKGTLLFTLGREVRRPGVYEMPFGTTYRALIEECGGGIADGRAVRAVLPAMSCGFLPAAHLDVPIGYETLKPLGTSPGCGGVRIVCEGDDPVALVLEVAQFFMREQCGQCPPCRMETNQFVHVLQGVLAGKGPGYAEKLHKVADFARGKGLCSLIEMAAAPVLSALTVFADDFARRAGG
ncbi:MAG TPA: NADH-ubiquinone oxidoreductase-F iron-sulfur binding region domain-containing protein [Planctomycetota bacterium]|nr:NADH-ubiquinone oxidoreductase-F iron-sulfur binding region domain-containing protein [Planctomycetota bacterium]